MKPKRIMLHHLQTFDLTFDDSVVRELEMTVESFLHHTGYSVQF